MKLGEDTKDRLRAAATVLGRAWILGMVLLLLWFGGVMAAGDLAFNIHSSLFTLTRAQFDLLNYYGIALFKLLVFCLFGIPWLAIRWTLAGQKRA